jgi:hypothetical protein
MEHLFFHTSDERVGMEVSSARFSDVLERDWAALARNTEVLPHVAPTTEWLGFEHERGRDQEMLPVQHDLNIYPRMAHAAGMGKRRSSASTPVTSR